MSTVNEPCNPFKVTSRLTCELKAVGGCQLPKQGPFTVTLKILLYVKQPYSGP